MTIPSLGLPGHPTFTPVTKTSPRISVLRGFSHCTLIHTVNPEIVGSPCLVMEILKENMAQDLTRPSPTPFTRIYRHLSLQMPSDFGRRRFNQGRGVDSDTTILSWPSGQMILYGGSHKMQGCRSLRISGFFNQVNDSPLRRIWQQAPRPNLPFLFSYLLDQVERIRFLHGSNDIPRIGP